MFKAIADFFDGSDDDEEDEEGKKKEKKKEEEESRLDRSGKPELNSKTVDLTRFRFLFVRP